MTHPLALSRAAVFIAVLGLVFGATARQAAAISGYRDTTTSKGITLSTSCEWFDGGGYRPVEVSVLAATPMAADQTLHIELHGRQNYYGQHEIAVSQDIELPAGSSGVVETIAVPQHLTLHSFQAEVWLNGRYSRTLSQPIRGIAGASVRCEGLPNVLLVTTAAPAAPLPLGTLDPKSGPLMSVFPADYAQQQYNFALTTKATYPAGVPLPTMMSLTYDRLPRRWIELSSLDLVCIDLGTLEQLAAKEPARCVALRQWLASGGNIIVFDVGPAAARADDAARLLAPTGSLTGGLVGDGWQKPAANDRANRLKSYGSAQSPIIVNGSTLAPSPPGGVPAGAAPGAGAMTTPAPVIVDELPPLPDPPPFVLRRIGSGMLLAADTDDLFAQPPLDWIWMLNSLGSDRWLWYRRHGLSLDRPNADFQNWLVRGVGKAPVTEFRVLISVFVLAIGPLNYLWLRRRGRLYLLVLVVPLAAGVVTFSLFGYAILADGLDVRVRARTLTQLDQRSGQAVCWSRLSYYAGMAPSGGLAMPDDVVVLPLTANENDFGDLPRRQNVLWSPPEQTLVSGWLPSRTPMQYITVRSRASQAALRVLPRRGGGLQVANQLGTRVIRLLLCDESGRCHRAADIAAGATAALEAVADAADEKAAIVRFVGDFQPRLPEDYVSPSAYRYGRRNYRYWNSANNSLIAPSQMSGRLEVELHEVFTEPGKAASAGKSGGFALGRRRYLALVERSPEVVYGVANPREEDSLHVIVGSW